MNHSAYLQSPSLNGDLLVFQSDDDIWRVSLGDALTLEGALGIQLTSGPERSSSPTLSPDGSKIAYLGHGPGSDVYLIDSRGGAAKQISFCSDAVLGSWKNNQEIFFSSASESFDRSALIPHLYHVKKDQTSPLKWGPASDILFDKQTPLIIARNLRDPARWKRYRGGTVGHFWKNDGKGKFKRFLDKLNGNLFCPQISGKDFYFLSDHEGVGQIYRTTLGGRKIEKVVSSKDYYIRKFSLSGKRCVYSKGGDLYLADITTGKSTKLNIHLPSLRFQRQERKLPLNKNIQGFSVSDDAQELALISRGQLFTKRPWLSGAQKWCHDIHRIREVHWSTPDSLLAVASQIEKKDALVLVDLVKRKEKLIELKFDPGLILEILPSPNGKKVALYNNRSELWIVDLKDGKGICIEKQTRLPDNEVSWSPEGRYLAYSKNTKQDNRGIVIYDMDAKKGRFIFDRFYSDTCPQFCPSGDYLYFKGIKDFYPIGDETRMEMFYPEASNIFVVSLRKGIPSPFEQYANFDIEEEEDKEKTSKKKSEKKVKESIDFDGIQYRIDKALLTPGGIDQIQVGEDKIFYIREKENPSSPWLPSGKPHSDLFCIDLKTSKETLWQKDVSLFEISPCLRFLIILNTEGEMRLVSTESKPTEGDEISKKDGWLDLESILVPIRPELEWKHMFFEAWKLQEEHFWNRKLPSTHWKKIYKKYLPLLPKINTRSEFSDLIWEMQGELETSHCYEMGGDYHRKSSRMAQGSLGASFEEVKEGLKIKRIYNGQKWEEALRSPLRHMGVDLEQGDTITHLDGAKVQTKAQLNTLLRGKAEKFVHLRFKRKGRKTEEEASVYALKSSSPLVYFDWVEQNRAYVHKASKGKLGYVHIPDMSAKGHSEFFREYLLEQDHKGLVVDVRYNGGGFISPLIIKHLAQEHWGFDKTPYFGNIRFPDFSVHGPLIAITNEHAGSDGDMFSHAFKLLELGELVGKRTWGGVVGISIRFDLIDGGLTSQPEFAFFFRDVGEKVENYGTDPTIDVDIAPHDYKSDKDPQLETAVKRLLKELR